MLKYVVDSDGWNADDCEWNNDEWDAESLSDSVDTTEHKPPVPQVVELECEPWLDDYEEDFFPDSEYYLYDWPAER